MGIRLYDSVWVELEGVDQPVQVRRDQKNAGVFNAGEFQYDIDGRPLSTTADIPKIARLHSLQSARDAGLATTYEVVRTKPFSGDRQGGPMTPSGLEGSSCPADIPAKANVR